MSNYDWAVEELSRMPLGESDKYDTDRILTGVAEMLRQPTPAGRVLRERLGLTWDTSGAPHAPLCRLMDKTWQEWPYQSDGECVPEEVSLRHYMPVKP